MTPKEFEHPAKSKDVEVQDALTVPEIIRAIQATEGSAPCYQSEVSPVCVIEGCLWRNQGCVSGEVPQCLWVPGGSSRGKGDQ
jgi:hypothetical protein